MDIPIITGGDISIKDIEINTIRTYDFNTTSTSLPIAAPVVVDIGVPVVNIPGCVEATETNTAKNNQLREDDTNGLVTYCDSGVPNFSPISYEPNQMILTGPPVVGGTNSPDSPEVPPAPEVTPPPIASAVVECPTPAQEAKEPVGTFVEGYRKKVIEYKLVGNECIQITEAVGIPQQIIAGLPSAGQVSSVGGIAVIATTSALLAKPLADLLLKVVKPTVKKVIKKIAAIRGKSVPILSLKERQDLQRERTKAIRVLKSALKPKG
ncbi:hypothetical protein ABY41_gp178 [Synechococcus phage ACG-2014i]|jgi:hypothetical protein|uniref:Uncharacterized protein n=1 Tax=Synechococcus phage ACG-2014i TaxID=1493513 RepID=A0A0E3FHT8_9CAUD|nr:hypothetical protein ABY41_gp178 [Synechococcus phage ACG-2014i]AIX26899.1 hypothetical protein Syn7803US120_178 [Synechococcus phage ACG-2014i]